MKYAFCRHRLYGPLLILPQEQTTTSKDNQSKHIDDIQQDYRAMANTHMKLATT